MSVKVKICGITNPEDAFWSASLGADFLGFNFHRFSKRNISEETAIEILKKLPKFVEPVAVFVDEPFKEMLKIVQRCGFSTVQIHGDKSPNFCVRLRKRGLKVIKAFRVPPVRDLVPKGETQLADDSGLQRVETSFNEVNNERILELIKSYIGFVDYILLDTYVESEPGGTGQVFNWDIALRAKEFNIPIFLAGGLNPENVKEAIMKVQPFAVDVASGVERSVRRKDFEKLRKFIMAVKSIP